jgi:hypothetical protein
VAPVNPVAPTGAIVTESQAYPFHFHLFPAAVNSSFGCGLFGKSIGIYLLFNVVYYKN